MPQDSVSITLPYKDSTFTVYSLEEYSLLPDSLKGSADQQRFVDSIFQLYTEASPPVTQSEEFITDDDIQVPGILFFIFIAIMIFRQMRKDAREQVNEPFTFNNDANTAIGCHTYPGRDLKLSPEEIYSVCKKHNPYFQKLGTKDQQLFTERVLRFIRSKNFYICAPRGYREMPILVSAAAVQISFGLKNYLLPHFSNIIIHPEEYFAYDPLRVLIGNVQGQSITLSWKHFLENYQQPTDGKNVGLHEMAHALQVQYLFRNPRQGNTFKDDFEHFDRVDDEVLLTEKTKTSHLFDANALSNKNEFWAASIELFFEKPNELKTEYPDLYESICMVLNQDPAAM